MDGFGNVFISDGLSHCVRRVDAATGIITTVAGTGAGGFSGDNLNARASRLNGPADVVVDAAGNIYIADLFNSRIRAVRSVR